MLPTTRIGPDLSRTVSKHHVSKPTQDVNRKRQPVRAAFAPAAARVSAAKANVAPTRTSLDHGIHAPTLEAVDPSTVDLQQQNVASSLSGSQSDVVHSTSCTSLAGSDSEFALLIDGADLSRPGTTTINIGSIPISVPLAYIEVPAAEAEAPEPAVVVDGNETTAATAISEPAVAKVEAAQAHTKLSPTSPEFYPSAYLAAAAATALAAQTVSSGSTSQQDTTSTESTQDTTEVEAEQQKTELSLSSVAYTQAQPPQLAEVQHQQQMGGWLQPQQWQHVQQWQQPMTMPVPMFFPIPVPVPPYMMPAYHYAWQQQWQHQQHQLHVQQMQMQHPPPAAPHPPPQQYNNSSSSRIEDAAPAPLSPANSLPADTSSLVSVPSAAAAAAANRFPLSVNSSMYSSRPGSSASSVVSGYTSRTRQHQSRARDAGAVTVSALSCVKDAAGALAKVVSRHGSCLLLSVAKAGDIPAQATHVAAKSLAVARFYVNAHMAAEGSAGVDAAAVLTGAEAPAAPSLSADDEVVFMPLHRSSSLSADADAPMDFIVAKANARDLPVLLPPPVGIPACMQDKQTQQQQAVDAVAMPHVYQSAAPLLKAGANTDVNKLSNAIIHNILGCNHVALQLAGAAACHVAMRALIKAHARLQRKFATDIVATASFANEDTTSSIGRSTVFLRLDVMRSSIMKQFMGPRAVGGGLLSRTVSHASQQLEESQQQAAAMLA